MPLLKRLRRWLRGSRGNESGAASTPRTWPADPHHVPPVPIAEVDLVELDHSYAGMYRLHVSCHAGLIAEIADRWRDRRARLLEVAAGSGWNTHAFVEVGFDYWACDISETALVLLLRRFPRAKIINAGLDDASVLADQSFDVVYCSALIEHLHDHAGALRQLVRLTRTELYVMFYEGLPREGEDRFQHFPFDNPDWRRWYGVKFGDYQDRHDGYFMKRYARGTIEDIVAGLGVDYEILDAANRPYLGAEAILHVTRQ